MPLRAVARVNLAAIERNVARARRARPASARAVRGRQGRRLRPRRACRPRAPRSRAARRGWRSRPPARRPSCARRASRRGCSSWARCRRASSTSRSTPTPTSSRGARRSWRAIERRGARARQARHRHGAPGHARPRARRRAWPAAVAAAPRLELAGAMTHFATADERGDAFLGEQLDALRGVGAAAARAPPGPRPARRQQRRRRCATRRRTSTSSAAGSRVYGLDPFQRGPGRARPRAGARAALLRRRGQAVRAGRERRLRAALRRRATRRRWRRCRSATATACAAALTNNADVLVGGRRVPLVGTVSMDNVTVDLGPDGAASAVGDDAVADRRAGRRADPRRGVGAAPRHDQLRDHVRDQPRGCRARTTATGRRTP